MSTVDELCEAAAAGDLIRLTKLIAAGRNVNRPSTHGMCPLNAAIAGELGNSDTGGSLLMTSDDDDDDASCYAIDDVDDRDNTQGNEHQSIDNALNVVRLLLDAGADVKQADSFRLDECRRQPIHYAAACDRLDIVRLLEKRGALLDQPDWGNSTPLHHAAANGNREIVCYLLSKGCNIHSRSNSGRTALWKAAVSGHFEVASLLLSVGSDVNVRSLVGATIFTEVLNKNDLQMAKLLLDYGANVNVRDVENNTPLHWIASSGSLTALKFLLSCNVNLNARNDHGNTPLHCATRNTDLSIVLTLLNEGVDVKVKNRYGQSALYAAVLRGHDGAAKLLISAGAELTSNEMERLRTIGNRKDRDSNDPSESSNDGEIVSQAIDEILHELGAIKKLTFLCRLVIRKALGTPSQLTATTILSLPLRIRDFLLLYH